MTKKRGGGPKPKYHYWLTDKGLNKIKDWAIEGKTNQEIAGKMGIAVSTLYEWLNKHGELVEALKSSKEVVDDQVEDTLLKRALGYFTTETRTETYKDGSIKVITTTKEILPDVTAQIFWLKNRRRDQWRDRQDLEHTGKDGGGIKIELAGEVKEWAK